jgi:hypothetical protein
MARSGAEQAAVQRANAVLSTEVMAGGGSGLVAHVRDCSPGDVDLLEEAKTTLERARREYPESEGWEVGLEAIVPHESENRHVTRQIDLGEE